MKMGIQDAHFWGCKMGIQDAHFWGCLHSLDTSKWSPTVVFVVESVEKDRDQSQGFCVLTLMGYMLENVDLQLYIKLIISHREGNGHREIFLSKNVDHFLPPSQAQASHQGTRLGRHQPQREVWDLNF